jgi:hypothetical protein
MTLSDFLSFENAETKKDLFLGHLKGWDERDKFKPTCMMHKIRNKLNSKNFLS